MRRLPSLCAWLPKLELLCPTGIHGLRVPVDCQQHPRFSTFLACLVFIWGVIEVLCAVTDQGPRILLDFLCKSGGVLQLVPTSSGYTWISRELHAVHVMLVPSLGSGSFGPVHRHRARGGMSTGTWLPITRCTYWRAWTDTFAKLHVRTTTTTTVIIIIIIIIVGF